MRKKTNFLPAVVILVLAITAAALIWHPAADTRSLSDLIRVPVPVDAKTAGGGPLSIGDTIDVSVNVPNEQKTLQPHFFPYLEVVELDTKAGPVSSTNRTEVNAIVVEVDPSLAPELLNAIQADSRIIIYQHVPTHTPPAQTATKSSTPTETSTPARTGTLVPSPTFQEGWIDWRLPAGGIPQLGTFHWINPREYLGWGQLVVVTSTITTSGTQSLTSYASLQYCVQVIAFLDKNEIQTTYYDKDQTTEILVRLQMKDFPGLVSALESQAGTYLVPVDGCEP